MLTKATKRESERMKKISAAHKMEMPELAQSFVSSTPAIGGPVSKFYAITSPISPEDEENMTWIPGASAVFKTPKAFSPVRTRRRTTMLNFQCPFPKKSEDLSTESKVPGAILSPPGVKTRSRRSSIYVAPKDVGQKDSNYKSAKVPPKTGVRKGNVGNKFTKVEALSPHNQVVELDEKKPKSSLATGLGNKKENKAQVESGKGRGVRRLAAEKRQAASAEVNKQSPTNEKKPKVDLSVASNKLSPLTTIASDRRKSAKMSERPYLGEINTVEIKSHTEESVAQNLTEGGSEADQAKRKGGKTGSPRANTEITAKHASDETTIDLPTLHASDKIEIQSKDSAFGQSDVALTMNLNEQKPWTKTKVANISRRSNHAHTPSKIQTENTPIRPRTANTSSRLEDRSNFFSPKDVCQEASEKSLLMRSSIKQVFSVVKPTYRVTSLSESRLSKKYPMSVKSYTLSPLQLRQEMDSSIEISPSPKRKRSEVFDSEDCEESLDGFDEDADTENSLDTTVSYTALSTRCVIL